MPPASARAVVVAALAAGSVLAGCGGGSGLSSTTPSSIASVSATPLPSASPSACAKHNVPAASPGPAVGPRSNLPAGAPVGNGMTNFSVVIPGVLARTGTPDEAGFTWLKTHGWKSVVDVRTTDDTTYSGFVANKFQYLWLPVNSAAAPTPDQARSFLCFVTNVANQPVVAHDNSGAERVSVFIALYRYAVQGWPMDVAVAEGRLYGDSLSVDQLTFLQAWANQYPPGTVP
jgi:Tyrosine phosphatase family